MTLYPAAQPRFATFFDRLLAKDRLQGEPLGSLRARITPGRHRTSGRLGLTKSTVSRLIDDMAERRLVKRRPDPTDGRAVTVELLTLGRKRAAQLQLARDNKYSVLLEAIPAEDRLLVSKALRVLTAAATAQPVRRLPR